MTDTIVPKLEELAEEWNVDLERWEAKKFHVSSTSTGKWWANADFVPRMSAQDFERIAYKIRDVCPPLPRGERAPTQGRIKSPISVLGLYDTHFGTRDNGSREKHQRDLTLGAGDLLAQVEPELLVVPIAGDIFHSDSPKLQTTGGTFVGNDVREEWHNSVAGGYEFIGRLVSQMSEHAGRVWVLVVGGNHDNQTTFGLGLFLDALFHGVPHIDVDTSADTVKYYLQDGVFLGFMHGHRYRKNTAVSIMANDSPEAWAQSTFRELHHGHYHGEMSYDEGGVVLRCNSALGPQSAWEVSEGYRRQHPRLTLYNYDGIDGLRSTFNYCLRNTV